MMESQYCRNILVLFSTMKRPYLIHHHDGKKIEDRRQKETIQVMGSSLTNLISKDVKYHLPNGKKEGSECNVTKGPSILKGVNNQENL